MEATNAQTAIAHQHEGSALFGCNCQASGRRILERLGKKRRSCSTKLWRWQRKTTTKVPANFNSTSGPFKDRDLYELCANASDGTIIASPSSNKTFFTCHPGPRRRGTLGKNIGIAFGTALRSCKHSPLSTFGNPFHSRLWSKRSHVRLEALAIGGQ